MGSIEDILNGVEDAGALDQLVPLVYDTLRRMARQRMAAERADHTLDATALVNEVYLRLAGSDGVAERGRTYLLGAAVQAMRRILIEHARHRQRDKRGGGWLKVTLGAADELALAADELLELDDAMNKLAAIAPRQASVIEARYFGGLSVNDTAQLLGVSARTVKSDWVFGRTWLRRALADQE